MLGKDGDLQPVIIAGGSFESLSQWNATRMRSAKVVERDTSPPTSAISSALSTPIDSATPNQA